MVMKRKDCGSNKLIDNKIVAKNFGPRLPPTRPQDKIGKKHEKNEEGQLESAFIPCGLLLLFLLDH